MSDLVDTTEMYLKALLELEEAQVEPLRTRIAERLRQSGPTVSQTVARLERHAWVAVIPERHRLALTEAGRARAVAILRKHRLAECFLAEVVELEWEHIHEEACRWEHVMGDSVADRLDAMLGHPTHTPYGNPVPARDDPAWRRMPRGPQTHALRLAMEHRRPVTRTVSWIGETAQAEPAVLGMLAAAGIVPGARVRFEAVGRHVLALARGDERGGEPSDTPGGSPGGAFGGSPTELPPHVAAQLYLAA